jgi:hypothetical protein
MPNVTSTGPARDALGRPGIGIEIAEGEGWFVPGAATAAKLTRTLIIDPGTSHVLADEARIGNRADPVSDTLVVAVGWTSEGPHEPALP